jgi:cell division septal protein FtsQ
MHCGRRDYGRRWCAQRAAQDGFVQGRARRDSRAYDALVQTGITRTSNVFDEFEPWQASLLKHPMVLQADIERELPNTIKVNITEAEPVALARTPELQPVDARGRILPIDPATIDLDLPVIVGNVRPDAAGFFKDQATRDVIAVLNTLRLNDQRLYSWISEVAPAGNQGLQLSLRQPDGGKALVASDPRGLRLRELEVALADLSARGELSQLKRIDARFRDQIVVSLDTENRH